MTTVLSPTQDTSKLRSIKSLSRIGITPSPISEKPLIKTIKLYKLRVNDEYQRGLSEASVNLIRKIVKEWSWAKYHVLVVCQITPDTGKDDDTYEVLDGQHTATAAATHGGIYELPCMIVDTSTLIEKAEAFVGLNKNKLKMTPIQIFWAQVASNDEDAIAVRDGASQANAKIVKRTPPYGNFTVGETIAVSSLMVIAKRGGAVYVRRILEVAVRAGLAPINEDMIRALDHLLLRDGYLKINDDVTNRCWRLSQAIRRLDLEELRETARKNKKFTNESISYNMALIIRDEAGYEKD
jgi:hypothetical protein